MTQRLCVASVPAAHPYVTRVLASKELEVLPDPLPPGGKAGQWWPPVELTPVWLRDHLAAVDVLHIHFGTESFSPQQLVSAVQLAHGADVPVILTVHDLVHPQLQDQTGFQRQLDALVPLVDAVVTLTDDAAAEIARRWNRLALVLPHPRLLDDDVQPVWTSKHDAPVIGVHLKDLRPNVDGPEAVRTLSAALGRLHERGSRATGEVRLHRDVRDELQREEVRALCSQTSNIVLLEHDRLSDAELAHALSHLDACMLPYRFGTHSGWLELCWDLGVPVAAPSVGFFSAQHDDATVRTFSWGDDGASLAGTLFDLLAETPPAGSEERQRLSQERLRFRARTDAATAAAHVQLYRGLLSGRVRT